jgi:4-methyl-5(b-hydroxyethyl)-thiazole monophosphate biosynthesis
MSKIAYIILADGFEETEAMGTWDTLRRGGVDASFVSINDTTAVEGAHGLHFTADYTLADIADRPADAIAMPGGATGAENLYQSRGVQDLIHRQLDEGRYVGAMCAAPSVLGRMGLLKGKRATIFPGWEKYIEGAEVIDAEAVVDGQIITARGPRYCFAYGIAILAQLEGPEAAKKVADALLLTEQVEPLTL